MLGIGAEWISWRLRLPSILVLLVVGVVAGPIIGILDPRILFSGGVLAPIVAISVAIILFEGALSLKLTDLRQIGVVVRNLVSIGVLVTCGLAAVAAPLHVGFFVVVGVAAGRDSGHSRIRRDPPSQARRCRGDRGRRPIGHGRGWDRSRPSRSRTYRSDVEALLGTGPASESLCPDGRRWSVRRIERDSRGVGIGDRDAHGRAPGQSAMGLSQPNPQGLLFIGAHPWAREMAKSIKEAGFVVKLTDTNRAHVSAARLAGLGAHTANILSESVLDDLDLGGIGRVIVMTSNDEVNSLACLHLSPVFGSVNTYQLPVAGSDAGGNATDDVANYLRGRALFGAGGSYHDLENRFSGGAVVKRTKLSSGFDHEAFLAHYGDLALPLFLVRENGELSLFSTGNSPAPRPGQMLISLVNAGDDAGGIDRVAGAAPADEDA